MRSPTPLKLLSEVPSTHTESVVFEDVDGDELFCCSLCTEEFHDDSGQAPTRASDKYVHDDSGRAPKRASDILCDNRLNPSIHPTIKDTQEKTRKERDTRTLSETSAQVPSQQIQETREALENQLQFQFRLPLQMPLTAMVN